MALTPSLLYIQSQYLMNYRHEKQHRWQPVNHKNPVPKETVTGTVLICLTWLNTKFVEFSEKMQG
jgi:hypothetical protein